MSVRTDRSYTDFIAQLVVLVQRALPYYGYAPDADIRLLSHSENTVFRIVDARGQAPAVIRVHRPNYQTRNAIQTELDWMRALNASGVGTPQALAALDGCYVLPAMHEPIGTRLVVMFEWIDGESPDQDRLAPSQRTLGQISARMHAQSKGWQRPDYFERTLWDGEGLVGPSAHWGQWEQAPGVTPGQIAGLRRTEKLMKERLAHFGQAPECFGLIHADLRIANLLVHGETTNVIDFDDCGLGWFMHDMASTLSFIEHRSDREALMDAWANGYCDVGTLSQAERDEFPTFLMQRRLQLLAWMGSHYETDLARSLGDPWVAQTAELGNDYLLRMG
ncbi:MAG TPA: phosphotransferase [Paraburkholderia sp.]|nr:phosphotransferase [Paraburkholderia sp.]